MHGSSSSASCWSRSFSAGFLARHFAITTDSKKLLSSSLPWRQQEIMLDRAFPQSTNLIIAVVDGATPEAADEAADALVNDLSPRSDVIRTIRRPDAGEFFARNGILFLSLDEVRRDTAELIKAQPFLGTLAADPTLRGVLRTLSQSVEGVRRGKAELEDLRPALVAIADALELLGNGKNPAFSWRRLITGRAPKPSELRRFVNIQPVLDFDALEPGGKATAAIREAISRLNLTPERGVRVRLTGSVALSDEEFATVADGAALNGAVTVIVVILVLWLALKQARIILAVLVNLAIGLTLTAAFGTQDGRRAEPHLRRFRCAFHRARGRFRHPVQRPLPGRAVCDPRFRPGASVDGASGGGAASSGRRLDRDRVLLVPADCIRRTSQSWGSSPEPGCLSRS